MSQALATTRPDLRSTAKTAAAILLGVALITLCAKIRVPSWPVPMTLHTMAVMTIALATGPRIATVTFLAYLIAGAAGLPVFSGTPERGIGLAYMVGPTGGYLVGFLAASGITGALASERGTLGRTLAMLVGLGVTYAAGLLWLGLYVPADNVLSLGFTPFIFGDLISIAMVALGAFFVPARCLGSVGQ